MNTAYFTNHQQQRFVYCLTLLLHPGGGGGGGDWSAGVILSSSYLCFLIFSVTIYAAMTLKVFDFYFLPINNVVAKLYGKGGNKFKIMIFLSRLPDKILLFFGSVNIM